MRRIAIVAAVTVALLFCVQARGQVVRYGVTAACSDYGYNAGFAVKFKLPAGFGVQPSLLYQVKGKAYGDGAASLSLKTGYFELPVQLQWGPDLLLFRPYVFAEPFVGVRLSDPDGNVPDKSDCEWGAGTGIGAEFWRIQLSARYFWNISGPYNNNFLYRGISVSAVYFF